MTWISLVLADDNVAILRDLRDELRDEFAISGTAENGEDATRAVLHLDPDVLVLDITMPILNGLEVASQLRQRHSRTKILFLSIHEESEYILAGFSAGASGCVTKRRLVSDLATGIHEVFEGRLFLSPTLKR